MAYNDNNVVMEGVDIPPGQWRNFEGKETQYNAEGSRNFNVFLPEDVAKAMLEDGWNIKWTKPREDDEELTTKAYLQVAVGYKGRPPRVCMITSQGRVDLGQHEVGILDWVDVKYADMIVRPYYWNVSGKTGVKAYLQSLFVTIEEDPLSLKYNEVPEIERGTKVLAIEAGADQEPGQDNEIVEAELVEE